MRFVPILSFGVGMMLLESPALAQSDAERAAARAAAQQGMKAYETGDWSASVEYFRKAQSLVDAPTHLLYIARSEEKLGHLVEAHEAYMKLDKLVLPAGTPDAFQKAQQSGREALPAIESRLPYVTIHVKGSGRPSAIRIDGHDMPATFLDIAVPIDPGTHRIQAVGSGNVGSEVVVTLAEASKETVELTLDDAKIQAAGTGPATDAPNTKTEEAAVTADVAPAKTPRSGAPSLRVPAYVSFGVGALGLVGGTYFVVSRSGKSKSADDSYAQFSGDGCLANASASCRNLASDIASKDQSAAKAGTLAMVGYGVGFVGIGVGVALLALDAARSRPESPPQAQVQLFLGSNQVGAVGQF
jgi:hypothetical protein